MFLEGIAIIISLVVSIRSTLLQVMTKIPVQNDIIIIILIYNFRVDTQDVEEKKESISSTRGSLKSERTFIVGVQEGNRLIGACVHVCVHTETCTLARKLQTGHIKSCSFFTCFNRRSFLSLKVRLSVMAVCNHNAIGKKRPNVAQGDVIIHALQLRGHREFNLNLLERLEDAMVEKTRSRKLTFPHPRNPQMTITLF